jgi:hypothetical protein
LIPLLILRGSPFNLNYPDLVFAKVRSKNINGWSEFSNYSEKGALIMTEPATMNAARRGNNTDQFSIHIVWDQLEGDSIRGGYITSYYLQWDKGTNGTNWYDLVGLTEPYLQLEFTATFGDVVPGTNY